NIETREGLEVNHGSSSAGAEGGRHSGSWRGLAWLVKADVLERTRRYGFLVTIIATLYLGYLVDNGTVGVHMGRAHPLPTSAWTGIMMALCTVTFVCMIGFYVVNNAVARDRETGVGQILAATSMSSLMYVAGKQLSNFIVLAFVTCILAAGGLLIQAFEGTGFAPWLLLGPFLFLAFPAMFFTGALAVLFECVGLFRGVFGNILYVFLFSALVMLPMETGSRALDVYGLKFAMDALQADVRAAVPDYDGNFTIGTGAVTYAKTTDIRWEGIHWNAADAAQRALPLLYAALLTLTAGLLFDRFSKFSGEKAARAKSTRRFLSLFAFARFIPRMTGTLFEAVAAPWLYTRMLLAETRLMIRGLPWWWYTAGLGLWVASVSLDLNAARENVLPFLWLLPVLLWSATGTREARHGTCGVMFSAPRPLARQFMAAWGAGVIVALIAASGLMVRLGVAGDRGALVALCAGAIFIPSLAAALGVWSRTARTFEAIYVALWYLGPLHHIPQIDFMGTTDRAVAAGSPAVFAAGAAVLFAAAVRGRRKQISG
ncbi:MAG TPA: hypothetical protein VML00_02780, partial [Bacteroidota bacterium]|nr:hypothetical protein [Bacteroidota bacterium]